MSGRGVVSIVGAGPGDPELVTVRGLRRIQAAEVLVYDRLVSPDLVAEAPATAERIFAGKATGFAALSQGRIERVLIERGRAGRRVVRLKGGDPFVFGRGGEEVAALVAHGVPVEVVPGLSSATAVPGSVGIPVTHRGLSSSVTIVTGHEDPTTGEPAVDWDWLAASTGTLVVLMGLANLPAICHRLIAAGRAPTTPAAVIASGTWTEQRVVTATLAAVPALAAEAQLIAPALVVVGDVVAMRELLTPAAMVGPLLTAVERHDGRVEPWPAPSVVVGREREVAHGRAAD
ncbi:MAG: uroporphyrinogen-III C-methyltransferase [Chloroflexota bacterium]|nr:uroporphyrinogen-III C-methyltransferase [Chloroflexota bacterium]